MGVYVLNTLCFALSHSLRTLLSSPSKAIIRENYVYCCRDRPLPGNERKIPDGAEEMVSGCLADDSLGNTERVLQSSDSRWKTTGQFSSTPDSPFGYCSQIMPIMTNLNEALGIWLNKQSE